MLVANLNRVREVAAMSKPIEQRRGKALFYKRLITYKRLILCIFMACRLRDYSALRASPARFARGRRRYARRSTSDVVEPFLCYVGGSNGGQHAVERNFAVLGPFCGICRLRDSNPRPTVYKSQVPRAVHPHSHANALIPSVIEQASRAAISGF